MGQRYGGHLPPVYRHLVWEFREHRELGRWIGVAVVCICALVAQGLGVL